jgi:predicted nucleotidyltransferase
MNFGLSDRYINLIHNIISKYSEIQEAIIFGSRADGTNRESSDIDIAIKCEKNDFRIKGSLMSDFEESCLPYFVDVVAYNCTPNEKLKSHIDMYGVVFYKNN